MAAVRPTCFSRPDLLRKMHVGTVRALLEPFAPYLSKQGIVFPIELETEFQQHQLATALAAHTASTPPELVERLEMISLLNGTQSTLQFEEDYADLLAECRGADDTPLDTAVKMFLRAPHIVWREFDRQAAKCQRTFTVFKPTEGSEAQPATPENLTKIESLLGPWFALNARSGWCRVRRVEAEDCATFLIYHGDLMNRVTVIDDDGSTRSELFRPERLDIVRHHAGTGEWLVSGNGSRVRDEFRRVFGIVFHGSPNALGEVGGYPLEPLVRGREALECRGGSAVLAVRLASVSLPFKSSRIQLEHGDVMASFLELREPGVVPEQAELAFKVAGLRYPVRVTINTRLQKLKCSSQIPAVEEWLEVAGFRNAPRHAEEQGLLDIA